MKGRIAYLKKTTEVARLPNRAASKASAEVDSAKVNVVPRVIIRLGSYEVFL